MSIITEQPKSLLVEFFSTLFEVGPNEVRYTWELNRHQHLITLGKAYFLTGNEKYAQEVCTQICDWIEANPHLYGINWTSSLELAIRLISWIWAFWLISDSKVVNQHFINNFLKSTNMLEILGRVPKK